MREATQSITELIIKPVEQEDMAVDGIDAGENSVVPQLWQY